MDQVQSLELVKRARELERLLVRRRKVLGTLRTLDDEVRRSRKLLRDLSLSAAAADAYAAPVDVEPIS